MHASFANKLATVFILSCVQLVLRMFITSINTLNHALRTGHAFATSHTSLNTFGLLRLLGIEADFGLKLLFICVLTFSTWYTIHLRNFQRRYDNNVFVDNRIECHTKKTNAIPKSSMRRRDENKKSVKKTHTHHPPFRVSCFQCFIPLFFHGGNHRVGNFQSMKNYVLKIQFMSQNPV